VDVGQERLEGPDPLGNADGYDVPLAVHEHPGHHVQGERSFLSVEVEGHPLVHERPGEPAGPGGDVLRAHLRQDRHHLLVVRSRRPFRVEHLVDGQPQRAGVGPAVAVEQVAHDVTLSAEHFVDVSGARTVRAPRLAVPPSQKLARQKLPRQKPPRQSRLATRAIAGRGRGRKLFQKSCHTGAPRSLERLGTGLRPTHRCPRMPVAERNWRTVGPAARSPEGNETTMNKLTRPLAAALVPLAGFAAVTTIPAVVSPTMASAATTAPLTTASGTPNWEALEQSALQAAANAQGEPTLNVAGLPSVPVRTTVTTPSGPVSLSQETVVSTGRSGTVVVNVAVLGGRQEIVSEMNADQNFAGETLVMAPGSSSQVTATYGLPGAS